MDRVTTHTSSGEQFSSRLVVVLRAQDAADYDSVIETLIDGGVDAIETTLTTPGALDALPRLVERFGTQARVGVGTVTNTEEAERALDCGAAFLVTPVVRPDVVTIANARRIPVFPGAFTPTEILAAWSAGATAVKVFPASAVGPRYFRDIAGPFPQIPLMPSGGVDLDNVGDWFSAGAVAVSIGSPLLQDAFRGGDRQALLHRTRALVDRVRAAEAERAS